MYSAPENTPVWVHTAIGSEFTALTAGNTENESIDINLRSMRGGVAPSQKQYVVNSVTIAVTDDDGAGMSADFILYFYADSNFDGAALADDNLLGYVNLPQSSAQETVVADLYYYADHDIGLNYVDIETEASGRPRVHMKLQENHATGTLAAADDIQIRLCLIPV